MVQKKIDLSEKDVQLFSRMQAARKDLVSFMMSEFATFILVVMLVFELNAPARIILAIIAIALALTTVVRRSLIKFGKISPCKNRIPLFLLVIQGCGLLLLMLLSHFTVLSFAIILLIIVVHLVSFAKMWVSSL